MVTAHQQKSPKIMLNYHRQPKISLKTKSKSTATPDLFNYVDLFKKLELTQVFW